MAAPISAMEILSIGKFAFDLYQKCRAAESEFIQISKEVLAMRTVIEMVHMECDDPESIINKVDTKEKIIRKKLRSYFDNCDEALKDVDKALEDYQKMNAFQKAKWAFFAKEEIEGLKSNLSSFATQLDSYVNNVTRQGVALVNKNIEIGLGKLEELLEKNNGDSQATVGEAMLCRSGRNTKPPDEAHYRQVITDYMEEIKVIEAAPRRNRPGTPPAQPNGNGKSNTLNVERPKTRPRSAGDAGKGRKASPSPVKTSPKKKKYTLECWLLQVRITDVGLFTTERMDKERMLRGQWKLEQMASQFKSSEKAKLADSDKLVQWVLADRKKEETDSKFTWHAHATKIEDKGSTYLGLKVEYQAMVIIRRQLTPEAQKKADEKELANQKKREAERKRKERESKMEEIKKKKEEAARRKADAEQEKKEREHEQKEKDQKVEDKKKKQDKKEQNQKKEHNQKKEQDQKKE